MTTNRPIYLVGIDDVTRARLRRELRDSMNMMRLGDLVHDEYKRLRDAEERRLRDAEDPEHNWNTWGGGDAA